MSKNNLLNFHFAFAPNGAKKALCLIDINADYLLKFVNANKSATPQSSHLVFWLFQTTLLETDYADLSANYPITWPTDTNSRRFGLSSGYFLDATENFLTNFNYYKENDTKESALISNLRRLREQLLYFNAAASKIT
jgi:hypothetical protein